MFRGALHCPYIPGTITHWIAPRQVSFNYAEILGRPHNWLFSPLGAIKAGHGDHILAAVVLVAGCRLRKDLVIDSVSPTLSIAIFPWAELPSEEEATRLLHDIDIYAEEIDAFERDMSAALVIPHNYLPVLRKACKRMRMLMEERQGVYQQRIHRLRREADALAIEIAPPPSIESAMLKWLNRLGENPPPLQKAIAKVATLWVMPLWPSRYRCMWRDLQIIQREIRDLELSVRHCPPARDWTDQLRQFRDLVIRD